MRSCDAGAGTARDDVLRADGLELDPASHRVHGGGQTVNLGPKEFKLLQFFMGHPDRVYSRSQLLDRVWGGNVYVEERTVDVHIRRLRKALESGGFDRFRADGPRRRIPVLNSRRLMVIASRGSGAWPAVDPDRGRAGRRSGLRRPGVLAGRRVCRGAGMAAI